MADKSTSTVELLSQILTPDFLQELRTFWFQGCNGPETLILPTQADTMRYFTKDTEFDKACVARFNPVLETIRSCNASPDDILTAAAAASPGGSSSSSSCLPPLSWLSLILLLDQLPRNCYRGPDASIAFRTFDPLAQSLALRAFRVDHRIPSQSPELRHRLFYRFWFFLPLMHSEDLAVHEVAVREQEEMAREVEEFITSFKGRDSGSVSARRDDSSLARSDDEKRCYDILSRNLDEVRAFLNTVLEFEKRHKVIIERFGRYPHRNEAMGREATPEEVEYLKNGGETFG